jgi:hypothetical protein
MGQEYNRQNPFSDGRPAMKLTLFAVLLTATLLGSLTRAQGSRPIPPGIRKAEQSDAQSELNIPPPMNPRRRALDPDKLKRDADELVVLAQSVPSEIDQATKGVLPKDLAGKLKKIEKLAKQLRSQLNP